LIILFVALFSLIAGRFIFIQATGEVQGVDLKKWAADKRKSSYVLKASRGKIFDSNGMPRAADRLTYRIYAIVDEYFSKGSKSTKDVADIKETAAELAPILEVDEQELIDRMEAGVEKGSFQVEFGKAGKELPQKTKVEIEELAL